MIEGIVHIKNGEITNRAAVRKFFAQHQDGTHTLQSKRRNKRSIPQNRYYWGVVVRMIRDRMNELGNDVTSDLVHAFLKDRFHAKEIVNQDGVTIGTVGDTTTEMNKAEFDEYMEKIKVFAAQVLDIYIPDPGQYAPMFTVAFDNEVNAMIIEK